MTRKIPELRFAGFSGEWDKKRLREISDITMGQSPSSKNYTDDPNELVLIQGNADLKNGKVVPRLFTKEITKLSYPDDIIFTVRAPVGGVAINKYEAVIGRGVCSISANLFLYYWLDYRNITNYWIRFSSGSTFDSINSTDLKNIEVKIPSIYEQEKIGELFEVLDACLEDQAAYVETLKKSKKAFLQKLFPQKGKKVPELRFPGFEGDWEEIELGNISSITTGKLDANAMVENGKYDFYTSGIAKYKIDTFAFEGPSITIAGNGATVGYMHLADGKFNAYQRTYVISDFKGDRHFIYYSIKTKLPKKIHEESRAGNIPYIVLDMLTNLKILLPTLAEQEKIGSFFKALDEKIEKEEDKLESLERLKRALLQKVFV